MEKHEKNLLREKFKAIRASISLERRQEASLTLANYPFNGRVLSFASFGTEVDMWPLNRRLCAENRLYLPKVSGEHLIICHITDLNLLKPGPYGILEPQGAATTDIPIDTILVPGLAFDKNNHRLGFGTGYYDRLLSQTKALSIGIAFREQLTEALPYEPHDIHVGQVLSY